MKKRNGKRLLAILLVASFLLSTIAVLAATVEVSADESIENGLGGSNEGEQSTTELPSYLISVSNRHTEEIPSILNDSKKLREYVDSTPALDVKIGQTIYLTLVNSEGYGEFSDVEWSSSNMTVATVSNTGALVARGSGDAVITAKKGDSVTTVLIHAFTSFRFNYGSVTCTVGQMYEVNIGMGSNLDKYLYDITWKGTEGNGKIVVVSGGLFQTQYSGTGSIEAIVKMDGIIIDNPTCIFNSIPAATQVRIDKKYTSIEAAQTCKLTGNIVPIQAEQRLRWESSDPSIASVDTDGTVHILNDGKVTFTCYAQYWNGTAYADVVSTKDGTSRKITDSFTADVWIQANYRYKIKIDPPDRCEYSAPVNAKRGETVTINTTREMTDIEQGWEFCSVIGVYPYDENRSPIPVEQDPMDTTVFRFTMPASQVDASVTAAVTHRITYTNGYQANFVRDNSLVSLVKVEETVDGAFRGKYTFKVGDPAVTIRIGDIMTTAGDVELNNDGTATVTFGEDSVGIEKEIYIYADSQDVSPGTYSLYISGENLSLIAPNVVTVTNSGYIGANDKLLNQADVSKTAYGDTLSYTVDNALLIYGTTFKYLQSNNISLDVHFKDGTIKIPYTAIAAIRMDDNDYFRMSFFRSSAGTNNSTLGMYTLTAVKGTGAGDESDCRPLMANCTIAVAHNGNSSKVDLKTSSSLDRMEKEGSVYSVRLDSLGVIADDGFEIKAVESPIKLGDVLFWGGLILLVAALGVAVYFLWKKYKAAQDAKKAEEAEKAANEEPAEEIPDDSISGSNPYTDATLKTVNDILLENGLADDAERIRQENLSNLRSVQTKGNAEVVIVNRDIDPLMSAARSDAETNRIQLDEPHVRKYLDEGLSIKQISEDVKQRCERDPETIESEELVTYTDELRNLISTLSTRAENYGKDYDTLGNWIRDEVERRRKEREAALDRLLADCDELRQEAVETKSHNDDILQRVRSIRPTLNGATKLKIMSAECDADRKTLTENLGILDRYLDDADNAEDLFAQELAGLDALVDLCRSIRMSEGIDDRMSGLRTAMNKSVVAITNVDNQYRLCSDINNRLLNAARASETMEKAGIVAQISAYVEISNRTIATRTQQLDFVKSKCLDVFPNAPESMHSDYAKCDANLKTLTADKNEAADINNDTSANFSLEVLRSISARLKADIGFEDTDALYNEAQNFISRTRANEFVPEIAPAVEEFVLPDTGNAMLNDTLTALTSYDTTTTPATDATKELVSSIINRDVSEYATNMKLITECCPENNDAKLIVSSLTAFTERVHQDMNRLREVDMNRAENGDLLEACGMLNTDMDIISEARRVICEDVSNNVGASADRLSRRDLNYWTGRSGDANSFVAAYAKNKLKCHHDSVAASIEQRAFDSRQGSEQSDNGSAE